MLVFPKAKINLGLRITGRRPDGYHDIETLFYPVGLCDALEIVAGPNGSEQDLLTITGNSIPGTPDDNIVLKSVRKLRETFPIPWLAIHLHKKIPAGAGLGGGSSDAASTLRTINRIFSLSIDTQKLKDIAATLGSDCPFFIESLPAFASGRGDILTPAPFILNGYYIVLANPGIQAGTREAYAGCTPALPENSLEELVSRPVKEWKDSVINDFEEILFPKYPLIKELKSAFYATGAVFSSMSGSGSTVFGIYNEKPAIPKYLARHVIFEAPL
ncbi:MAG: 4-(cytidine 5'-diphospho)-2-C-methyl-D-erythritol kinase [Bacteroidales bacterium]|nr:4-(cytidine 5'-diphospho)-2-C-methyl-D-erythritol kinase [Bacteroidales bacterium]